MGAASQYIGTDFEFRIDLSLLRCLEECKPDPVLDGHLSPVDLASTGQLIEEGWCPLPWPRRAASAAMLEVAAGGGYRVSPCVLQRRLRLCGPIHTALSRGPPPACAGRLALCCLDFPLQSGFTGPERPSFLQAHTV